MTKYRKQKWKVASKGILSVEKKHMVKSQSFQ